MTDHNRNKALVILEAVGLCLLALLVLLVWVLLWIFRLMGDGARFFLGHLTELVLLLRDRFGGLRREMNDSDDDGDEDEDDDDIDEDEADDGEEEPDTDGSSPTLDAQEASDEKSEGPRAGLLYDWLCEQVSGVSARAEAVDAESGDEEKA